MEQVINELCGNYAGLVLAIMGVCAAVAALLPAPADGAGVVYRVVYRVLNILAANVGRARNADDAAASDKRLN